MGRTEILHLFEFMTLTSGQGISATSLHPAMTVLPVGHFRMGGRESDKFASGVEFPLHPVNFSHPVALAVTPVTVGQWRAFRPDWPSEWAPECPVVKVSFPDVAEYLAWLGDQTGLPFRLPSEAEWEYACRAEADTIFPHGNDLQPADACYGYDESGLSLDQQTPPPVGQYPANGWGIHDCIGTVNEWTADRWHSSYHGAPDDGSAWLQGGYPERRVIRGGAWDLLPRVLRCSWRDWAPESARWDNLGFRLALNGEYLPQ